jgi:hypothetical protein
MWKRLSVKKPSNFAIFSAKKLAALCLDMEKSAATLSGQCFKFPTTNATIGSMLDWFRMEVQALPTAFTESDQNITGFGVAGILRMFVVVQCGHLPELQRLEISSDTLLLQKIPDDIGKIAGKHVRNWWTNHGLLYCMQWVEEDNRVSSISVPLFASKYIEFLLTILVCVQLGDDGAPQVMVLAEVQTELEKTPRRTRPLSRLLQQGRLWLVRRKLRASPKFLTRWRCERVEFRFYLGGWRFSMT